MSLPSARASQIKPWLCKLELLPAEANAFTNSDYLIDSLSALEQFLAGNHAALNVTPLKRLSIDDADKKSRDYLSALKAALAGYIYLHRFITAIEEQVSREEISSIHPLRHFRMTEHAEAKCPAVTVDALPPPCLTIAQFSVFGKNALPATKCFPSFFRYGVVRTTQRLDEQGLARNAVFQAYLVALEELAALNH